MSTINQSQQIVDGSIVAAAFSSPWWINFLHEGIGLYMLVGAAILLTLRIYMSIAEIRRNKTKEE